MMDLECRWVELTGHPEYWNVLKNKYNGKGRHYHTLDHIEYCLEQLDSIAPDEIENVRALEMAIFFHDFEYNVDRKDNEYQSAWAAIKFIKKYMPELKMEFAMKVADLIMATVHDGEAEIGDAQLMADIDLAAFSVSDCVFDQNQEKIRNEYANLSDGEFYKGSINLLLGFLERPCIYYTLNFDEVKARTNIKRRIHQVVNNYF